MAKKKRIAELYAQLEQHVPDFMTLGTDELVDWLKERYEWLSATQGATHQSLADAANMPKGTVDRILAGKYRDFRWSTIQPLIAVMLRQDAPAEKIEPGNVEQVEDAQQLLEGYKITIQEKNAQMQQLLDHIVQVEASRDKGIEALRTDWQAKVDYLKRQTQRKDQLIAFLSICLGLLSVSVAWILLGGIL